MTPEPGDHESLTDEQRLQWHARIPASKYGAIARLKARARLLEDAYLDALIDDFLRLSVSVEGQGRDETIRAIGASRERFFDPDQEVLKPGDVEPVRRGWRLRPQKKHERPSIEGGDEW